MSPAEILEQAAEDGVLLALLPSGSLSAKGPRAAIDRWLPAIRQSKAAIVALLRPGVDCSLGGDRRHTPTFTDDCMVRHHCSIDLETRSELDLKIVGLYRYAQHPSTKILCACYAIDEGPIQCWKVWAEAPMPRDLRDVLYGDVMLHAWNAGFERIILKFVLGIEIPAQRWRCTQARARSMALPGKLELCAQALKLPSQKANNTIMLKWCKPLRHGGWASNPHEFEQLCAYCAKDVEVEKSLGRVVRELPTEEQRDYEINECINDRGIAIDIELVRAAQGYAKEELVGISERITQRTCGAVTSPNQFVKCKNWLSTQGITLTPGENGKGSFNAVTRAALLEEQAITGVAREVIQAVHDAGKASTAKFTAMINRAEADGRVRGAYVFNGGGQTGRYSSSGVQLHNIVRGKLDNAENVRDAILQNASPIALVALSGQNVLTTLSRLLRSSIVAEKGNILMWADWAAIEARMLPWLSGEPSAETLLDIFRSGGDVYRRMAMSMFGVPCEADVRPAQRGAAKVAVLACGYQGGVNALQQMAKKFGITVDDAQADVYKQMWRSANPWAQNFWAALERAAFNALSYPGAPVSAGRVCYQYSNEVLSARLPSGRSLSYPQARIDIVEEKFGTQRVVTCIKGSLHPKRGEANWPRQQLYGGLLCENLSQGESASLLRWTLRRLADCRMLDAIIGHTHDEVILSVPEAEAEAAKKMLADIMTSGPAWAAGLPLAVEISSGYAYGK